MVVLQLLCVVACAFCTGVSVAVSFLLWWSER